MKMLYVYLKIYYDLIGTVLLQGGDTDTNACIVGGMIGAAVGIDKIPSKMKDPVLSFKPTKGKLGIMRPDFLIPAKSNLLEMLEKVYLNSPKEVTIIHNGSQSDKKTDPIKEKPKFKTTAKKELKKTEEKHEEVKK